MLDTIFAPATAPGRAGVGIIRISGPLAHTTAERLCGTLPEHRSSALRWVRDSRDGSKIDQALILRFDAHGSFTGEPVVEIHHHGSPAVLSQLVKVLADQPGLRIADAGEFTRRSLENGRLDLSQVEGLSDLLDADTESQRRQALRVMDGELSRLVVSWRADLLRSIALIEATIDFADEDVPVDVYPEVRELVRGVLKDMKSQLSGAKAAADIRGGFEVAIVGRPNTGKSSLINRLSRRDVALISDYAGTTRDVIEARLDVSGHAVTFLDTAGLRETSDVVEGMGIDLAKRRATSADMRIFLLERDQVDPDDTIEVQSQDLIIHGKDDDGSKGGVSSLSGRGIERLLKDIEDRLNYLTSGSSLLIRERHQVAMRAGAEYLGNALSSLDEDYSGPEFVAEDLRSAIHALDQLIGRIGVEDVLGDIFSSFCIGK